MSRLYASMGLVPLVPYDVMGPCGKNSRHGVPCVTLRKLWDRSHIVSKQTYGTGPICASENTIRPVPCMSPICDPQTPQWVVKIRMNEMAHSIPAGMKWPIPFRPEWNDPFHSGRNEMTHSIPAGMKVSIPARMKWIISFRPEWNGHSVDANKKYASRRLKQICRLASWRCPSSGRWRERGLICK